jgi:flagellar biosynthesis protein FlhA
MATHLSELIKRHAHELLGRQEVQNLLDTTAKSYPKLVEELVPNLMSLGGVMRVLQNLLREDVSIRDMRTILETLADHAPRTQDEELLTEYVRQSLARQISNGAAGESSLLPVITLDTGLEETIQKSVQYSGQGSYLALEPRTAERLLTSLSEQIKQSGSGTYPVLLCAPNIRPHVKRLTEQYIPQLPVLSYNEVTPQLQIQSLGTVQLNAS